MKIICDNCRTKYSIADEKVKGKVFKIRCKKCSNIIVVRGNQPQSEAEQDGGADAEGLPAGAESGYKDAPVWHLVVDQQQVGPMTGAEVRDRFAQGEVDADTYVWREGFSDWLRLSQVDDFADIAQATTVGAAAAFPSAELSPQSGFAAAALSPQSGFAAAALSPQAGFAAGAGAQQGASGASGGMGSAGSGAADWGGAGRRDVGGFQAPGSARPAGSGAAAPGASGGGAQPAAWQAPHSSGEDAGGLFGGGMGDRSGAGGGGADGGPDLFGAQAGGAASPFGTARPAAGAAGGGLFGTAGQGAAAPVGGDLFGGGGGNGAQEMFPQEQSEERGGQQLTGARHENSVLFSLSNLQALAMGGGGRPDAAPAPSGPAGSVPPTDGSGLIDIRAMANLTASGGHAAQASRAREAALPDLGFSAPIAAAPVLMPIAGEDRPKWLIPTIIGGVAVVVLGIVAIVLVLVLRPPPQPVAIAALPAATPVGTAAVPVAAAGAAKAGPGGAAASEHAAAGGAQASGSKTTDDDGEDRGKSGGGRHVKPSRRVGGGGGGGKASRRDRAERGKDDKVAQNNEGKGASSPAPSAGKAGKPQKRDDLDDLIDGATGGSKPKRAPKAAAAPSAAASGGGGSDQPQRLGRAQIVAGMKGILGRVQGCYDRYKVPGTAMVQVSIGGSGRVNSARVSGMFAGTPTGACVQAAVMAASFDRFSDSSMTVTYPFLLR